MAVSYDLNAIADALAATWANLDTLTIDSQMVPMSAYSEVPGEATIPAVAVELDSMSYDESMARGADAFVFLVHLIISSADSRSGQRLVRQALSTGGVANKLKDKLEANQRLGGLVSYAVVTRTRSIGDISYGGVDYLGATLEVEVMS